MKYPILLIMLCGMLFAQKPVRIDEILVEHDSFRVDTTFSYSNIQSNDNLSASQKFQTQNGDFVTVPVYLGILSSNRDYLNMDMTIRYGLTKELELFVSFNGYYSDTKITTPNTFRSQNDHGLSALSTGITYQVKPEDATPSLLIGASAQLFEKTKIDGKTFTDQLKSFRVYATSFYSVDPVVFLLSASYSFHLSKSLATFKRDDADIFTFSPQLFFAVNPYTNLNWGVRYTRFGKTKVDRVLVGNSGSNMSYVAGVSYEFSAKTFISINAEFLNTNAFSQDTVSLTISYTF